MDALDSTDSVRAHAQVDRACASATSAVQALCHRAFFPTLATREFPWPAAAPGGGYRLWLDEHELISASAVTGAGVVIAPGASGYYLEPSPSGPPYDRLELSLSSSATFGGGASHQRAVSVTGLYGYGDDSEPAGALAALCNASVTTIDVTNGAAMGVGDVLTIGSERVSVDARAMLYTGQTLAGSHTASVTDTAMAVTVSGAAYTAGEILLVDSERVQIQDVAGDTLVVKRAVQGTTLASHAAFTAIHAPRRLTVTRGVLGTTAASHSAADAVRRYTPPGPVNALAIAEAIWAIQQERSGFARTIGSGEGVRNVTMGGIRDLRNQVYCSHGRKARIRSSA
jgi:hypothetical protein